ncbi:MAG TPA: hypothetical protein DDZ41_04525, partial [Flavobacterium sp.]|nr:hypothetical protein [Flavobacterium sp.]
KKKKQKNIFFFLFFANPQKTHPLIGIYDQKITPFLKKAIEQNELKMMDLVSKLNHQIIAVKENKQYLFKNIHTKHELEELNLLYISKK